MSVGDRVRYDDRVGTIVCVVPWGFVLVAWDDALRYPALCQARCLRREDV